MQRVTQEDRVKSMNSTDFLIFVEAVSKNIVLNPTAVKFFHRLYEDKLLNTSMHTGRLVKESKEHIFKYRCMMSELKHHAMVGVAAETCTLLGLTVPDYIKVVIPTDVVSMCLPKSKPKFDDKPSNLPDGITKVVDVKINLERHTATGRSHALKQQHYMLAYGAGAHTLSKSLGISREDAERMKSEFDFAQHMCKPLLNTDMSSLEARVMSSHLCQEILLDTQSKPCNLKEKPMNLSVTRPVLVGTTDILTAQPFQLDAIIREAKDQIAAGSDLQDLSQHHRNIKAELEEVITLCVEQLDKGLEKEESLVS